MELKINRYDVFKGWLEENVWPCNWRNTNRFRNWMAIVDMDADGKEARRYLDLSREDDLFFNISAVRPLDIVAASVWDSCKQRQTKQYYICVETGPDFIRLAYRNESVDFTTFRKTWKELQKYLEEQKAEAV